MGERSLREWLAQVRAGTLSWRQFSLALLGLSPGGPMVARLLRGAGVVQPQPRPAFTPAERVEAAS
jgi:hypothetical protein